MKWYAKYTSVFEKEDSQVSPEIKHEIRERLKAFSSDTPLISAVIIAHNEEKHLWSCLWSLCENECPFPIEIIGIDNLSQDKTGEIFRNSGIRYFTESRKGPGHARQCGLEHARGKYYICLDADTLYPRHYFQTMLNHLERKNIAGVYGFWSFLPDQQHSATGLWFYETLRDIHLRIQAFQRPELCVRGMVFGFRTSYGQACGFRTDIRRGEDGSLALALKEYGKLKLITTRKARPITATTTLNSDGSLLNSLWIRLKKQFTHLGSYLSKKNEYKDEDSNLLHPENKN